MHRFKAVCFAVVLLGLFQSMAFSAEDSLSSKRSLALTIHVQDFSFESGFGGTIAFSSQYSAVALIDAYTKGVYNGYDRDRHELFLRDVAIKPYISLRRHFGGRTNVAPFVGVVFQPSWHIGETRRLTKVAYGLCVGVESWVSENISFTGQQSFLDKQCVNDSSEPTSDEGRSSIFISFYF